MPSGLAKEKMNHSKPEDYGAVAKLLHWLILVLLAVQFAIAWTMPDIGRNTRPEGLVAWHLSGWHRDPSAGA